MLSKRSEKQVYHHDFFKFRLQKEVLLYLDFPLSVFSVSSIIKSLQTSGGVKEDTPFNWTVSIESSIDASYFAGYLITQVPGGFFASMYPANKIFGAAIAISAIFNMFIPGAMSIGPVAVVMLKVAQGFVEVSKHAISGIQWMYTSLIEEANVPTSFRGSPNF